MHISESKSKKNGSESQSNMESGVYNLNLKEEKRIKEEKP